MKTDRLLLDHIRRVLEAEGSLEAKAQRISQMIRAAGVYRWVGIYAVEGEEIVCLAWSGGMPLLTRGSRAARGSQVPPFAPVPQLSSET